MPASHGQQSALSRSLLLYLAVAALATSTIHAASNVSLGSKILPGDTTGWLSAPKQLFRLAFYNSPENSNTFSIGVLYNAAAAINGTVVWTAGGDIKVSSSGSFELSADGNLVLRNDSITTVWNSSTAGIHVAASAMGDDGNFVLLNTSGGILWRSFDTPTDTLVFNQQLPQGKSLTAGAYSASMQANGNLSLIYEDNGGYTYWSSNTAGAGTGPYHAILETPGRLSIYDESQFVGGWNSKDYTTTSTTPTRRLTLDSDGNLRIYTWSAGTSTPGWTVGWEALEDYCQIYAYCGPNGLCAYNETGIICTCATQAGYDFKDGNNHRSGCTAIAGNGGQNCSDATMVELNNTLLFVSGKENRIFRAGEVECSGNCLQNPVCTATTAVSDGSGTCQFTATSTFFSGYRELSISTNSYFKYCGPSVPPAGISIGGVVPGTALSPEKQKSATVVTVVVSVLATLAILAFLQMGMWWVYCRKKPRWGGYSAHYALMEYASGAPVQLTFKELRKATGNFKEKLGEGGFGVVYRGELSTTSDTGAQGPAAEVAVKRLEGLAEHGEKQFRMEMAVIGSTHHVNLVRLCGFCAEGKERILVYEYMRNGSLDKYLFAGDEAAGAGGSTGSDRSTGWRRNMDWETRFSMLLGTARGITYLHQECRDCIIHSDIKPENILLDDTFTAKVSDFGLAKLTRAHQKPSGRHITTLVRGTRGYLAPEWRSNLPITVKSDVYSFGVVVLETVSGRRSFEASTRQVSFPEWAYRQYFHHKQVIFPALDSRVKNIAKTYLLEHKEESDLFDQMLETLNIALKEKSKASTKLRRELICHTEAIQTTLCKHMSKEEEQVLPLLIQHFSINEQAGLVWQFMCSIPVNFMEVFLPWLASCLSEDEHQEMIACMHQVIPNEKLLQQVVFAWLRGPCTKVHENIVEEADEACEGVCISGLLTKTREYEFLGTAASIPEECPRALKGGIVACKRRADYLDNHVAGKTKFPIDALLYWHVAIRKELTDFAQELKSAHLSGCPNLSVLSERLQFLIDACSFHSAAEDKVLFPAIAHKAKQHISFVSKHADEEHCLEMIRHYIEACQMKRESITSEKSYGKLYEHVNQACKTIQEHFLEEEAKVFPLARENLSIHEQRLLVYQSFRVMPLKLLEKVLPWLVGVLSEQEVKNMLENICLAAPASDAALAFLLLGWACKGQKVSSTMAKGSSCFYSNDDCFVRRLKGACCKSGPSLSKQGGDECAHANVESMKRTRYESVDSVQGGGTITFTAVQSQASRQVTSCCVPALGVGLSSRVYRVRSGTKRLAQSSTSKSLQASYLGSGLFGLGINLAAPGCHSVPKPIDTIFQFHKAIRKDLEYLDSESAKLADCDVEFLRQFNGRFRLLWGLYRAHSNAEDEIVFPALEARETLHNVSHSYTIDHKHEEQLFKEISNVLSELFLLCGYLHRKEDPNGLCTVHECESTSINKSLNIMLQKQSLASKLQGMCTSIRVTLDQHVSREEIELWPLFALHFTTEEQEKIVGQIIGTTGAEVLQAMLPWVTTALSQEEQSTMMSTWRQATRNTMFDKWLQVWWKGSTVESPNSLLSDDETPKSGTSESLQVVAEYLSKGMLERKGSATESIETNAHVMVKAPEGDEILHGNASFNEITCHDMEASVCEQPASSANADCEPFDKKFEEDSAKFKPGWQDIFRMNEMELEAAIRKVSGDLSLDPRRKAYLIQNLLTSRWIVAQQNPSRALLGSLDQEEISGRSPSYTDADEHTFGCEHYKRNCKVRASCCGALFSCRFCHDKVSDHTMNRQATKEMMCMRCLEIQPVAQYCATPSCEGFCMARYYCSICKLFDDTREIYHCPSCNLCRVGKGLGIDFFHCMMCNACMSTSITSHKCMEKGLESNCPICHDFLFTSHTPVKALSCGHFMHSACYRAYTYSHYTCPICSKSLGDMEVYFGMLDALLASEQLPEEYRSRQQEILCNDCEQKGIASFHWLYHKCSKCGSYNTRSI